MRDEMRCARRQWNCQNLILLVSVIVVLATSGCTTLPLTEFASYKETFVQARKAGEDVLIDYSVATKEFEGIEADRAASKSKFKLRSTSLDAASTDGQIARIDHVAVRIKAWDVVARYNDLLSALAEGKAATELTSAIDALSASLGGFPIAQVAATAADVTAFLAPLKPLIQEAFREKQRRDFVDAVAKGGDLIYGKFLKLLRDDVADFYKIRKGLNDLVYQPIVDSVALPKEKFSELASQLKKTPALERALATLNAEIAKLPSSTRDKPALEPVKVKFGDGSATPEQLEQLRTYTSQARDSVAKALAKNAELDAYGDVLTAYKGLLNQLEQSMRNLQVAASQSRPTIPRGEELQRSVILLREAYDSYKDMR